MEFHFYPYVVTNAREIGTTRDLHYKFEEFGVGEERDKIAISLRVREGVRLGTIRLTENELVQLRTDITKFLIEKGYHQPEPESQVVKK